MRDEAIAMLYESIKDRAPFSLDEFNKCLEDWKVLPLQSNDEIIGAVIQKDNELHIGYGKKSKASIRGHLRILSKVIQDYGFCVTSVLKNNPQGLNFCKRLGFFEIAEESDKILLRCDRSRYVA
jgi:hypothetical protein